MTSIALRHHRPRLSRPERAWLIAWLGGPVIGIANGVTRELVYADRVGDLTAHQLSTASAVALFAGYFWLLQKRHPLPDGLTAARVGITWLALTVLFEFGFGHYVDGQSWAELLKDYDVAAGHLWPLALAWIAAGPEVVRRLS
jgi:hypothetical protein